MAKIREHYLVFKGDDIAGNEDTLVKAKEAYNKLPPKKRILDGRAIYKLVKEE